MTDNTRMRISRSHDWERTYMDALMNEQSRPISVPRDVGQSFIQEVYNGGNEYQWITTDSRTKRQRQLDSRTVHETEGGYVVKEEGEPIAFCLKEEDAERLLPLINTVSSREF